MKIKQIAVLMLSVTTGIMLGMEGLRGKEEQEKDALWKVLPGLDVGVKIREGKIQGDKTWVNLYGTDELEFKGKETFKEKIEMAKERGMPYVLVVSSYIIKDPLLAMGPGALEVSKGVGYSFYDAAEFNKGIEQREDFAKGYKGVNYYSIDGIDGEFKHIGSLKDFEASEEKKKFLNALLKATTIVPDTPEKEDEQLSAQFALASYYARGKGTEKDSKLALKYYKPIADGKSKLATDAQTSIGSIYFKGGDGVPKDPKKGTDYWVKAAEAGNVHAQVNLGKAYFEGKEVPQDYAKAVKYFKLAADQGDQDGIRGLKLLDRYKKK